MTGHKLVRFNDRERAGLVRFVRSGGLLFSDDCNHDIEGLYPKSFEAEMHRTFTGPGVLDKLPNIHPLYSAFFRFPDGPPQTSHELNGWGDNMVHDYLRGIDHRGRLGVRLRVGLRLAQQAVPPRRHYPVRGQHRCIFDDLRGIQRRRNGNGNGKVYVNVYGNADAPTKQRARHHSGPAPVYVNFPGRGRRVVEARPGTVCGAARCGPVARIPFAHAA
jgi:hypothetical protein